MTNEIIINERATATAEGIKRNKNSKPVMCLETGEIFTSATDAGIKYEVSVYAISANCLGKTKTCKGKHFIYLSKMPEHTNDVSTCIQTLAYKAKLYDEMMAEKEAKEREERAKVEAEVARLKEIELLTKEFYKDKEIEEKLTLKRKTTRSKMSKILERLVELGAPMPVSA